MGNMQEYLEKHHMSYLRSRYNHIHNSYKKNQKNSPELSEKKYRDDMENFNSELSIRGYTCIDQKIQKNKTHPCSSFKQILNYLSL